MRVMERRDKPKILSLHQGNTESRKCTEQRLIFKIGTLSPAGMNERFSFW